MKGGVAQRRATLPLMVRGDRRAAALVPVEKYLGVPYGRLGFKCMCGASWKVAVRRTHVF